MHYYYYYYYIDIKKKNNIFHFLQLFKSNRLISNEHTSINIGHSREI